MRHRRFGNAHRHCPISGGPMFASRPPMRSRRLEPLAAFLAPLAGRGRGYGAALRRLTDTPEKGQRRLHNAGDIFAPSIMTEMHAERRVEDMVEAGLVQPPGNRLLLIGTLCVKPCRNLRFDLRAARPTAAVLFPV